MLDIRKILEFPPIYNFFQKIVGAEKSRYLFIKTHVVPLKSGARVLEIGCGPGTNCNFIPETIDYVGCDINVKYIEYARKKFGYRGKFFATPVGQLAKLSMEPFDMIMAVAVLHHLSDDQILTLCDEVKELLKPGGSFLTGDPCFTQEQSRVERFITSCDRGQFVRYPEKYKAILNKRFPKVQMEVKHAGMLIPCTAVTMIATKE